MLPKIPVLVISGMPAEEEYEGMDVLFRMKPLQPECLLDCVRDLIGRPVPSENIDSEPALRPAPAAR